MGKVNSILKQTKTEIISVDNCLLDIPNCMIVKDVPSILLDNLSQLPEMK